MSDSEVNGNIPESYDGHRNGSNSVEDLSEYTDADESISAPTEILAEFLSSIMMKDYETALRYCRLILNYEPNNSTAKEFYPLIVEKLEMMENDYENSSSECSSSLSSSSCNSGGATSESYSSLSYDDAESDHNDKEPETPLTSEPTFNNGNDVEISPTAPQKKFSKGPAEGAPKVKTQLMHSTPTRILARDVSTSQRESNVRAIEQQAEFKAIAPSPTRTIIHTKAPVSTKPPSPSKNINKLNVHNFKNTTGKPYGAVSQINFDGRKNSTNNQPKGSVR